ncbi:MAG: hypothetical protein ABR976_16265 [Terracidiphilus sp.]|jgi:hypothetical protein
MSFAAKNSKSIVVLSVIAVVYFGVQWLGASSIGRCRIFSSTAGTDRADYAAMINQFSNAAGIACASPSSRTILFEDEDVITPYFVSADGTLGHCNVARLTRVTPLTDAEAEACGNLLVTEITPPGPQNLNYKPMPNPNFARHQWVRIDRWFSADGRYGFTIYSHPCATNGDRTE